MRLKTSLARWRPSCLGLNVLSQWCFVWCDPGNEDHWNVKIRLLTQKDTNKGVNKGETEYGLITIFIIQRAYFAFKRDKFWHQIRGELSKQEKLSLLCQLYLYLYMCLLILIAGAVIYTVSPSSLWLGTFVIGKILSGVVIWPACGSRFVANLTKSATAHRRGHYGDVIMSAMASQITGVPIVCLNVCSGTDQRNKHQSRGESTNDRWIHWWIPLTTHKEPVMPKMFPFCDTNMRKYVVGHTLEPIP